MPLKLMILWKTTNWAPGASIVFNWDAKGMLPAIRPWDCLLPGHEDDSAVSAQCLHLAQRHWAAELVALRFNENTRNALNALLLDRHSLFFKCEKVDVADDVACDNALFVNARGALQWPVTMKRCKALAALQIPNS